jgi:hypothetical protein
VLPLRPVFPGLLRERGHARLFPRLLITLTLFQHALRLLHEHEGIAGGDTSALTLSTARILVTKSIAILDGRERHIHLTVWYKRALICL